MRSTAPRHGTSKTYFGHEYRGQALVLGALSEQAGMNPDHVPTALLQQCMEDERVRTIARQFPYLMGFADSDALFAAYPDHCHALAEQFLRLAAWMYPKWTALFCKDGKSVLPHVYDLSCFMRLFAACHAEGAPVSADVWLGLMRENTLLPTPYEWLPPSPFENDEARQWGELLMAALEPYAVQNAEHVQQLDAHAEAWCAAYAQAFATFAAASLTPLPEVAARAYVINEDRFYLFPAFTPTYAVALHPVASAFQKHRWLERMILANQRAPWIGGDGCMVADIRLFVQGYSYTRVNSGWVQACLCLDRDQIPQALASMNPAQWQWLVDGQVIEYEINETPDAVQLLGPLRPMVALLETGWREKPLMFSEILIMCNNINWRLDDLLEASPTTSTDVA